MRPAALTPSEYPAAGEPEPPANIGEMMVLRAEAVMHQRCLLFANEYSVELEARSNVEGCAYGVIESLKDGECMYSNSMLPSNVLFACKEL